MTILAQEQFPLLNNKIHNGWEKKNTYFLTKGFVFNIQPDITALSSCIAAASTSTLCMDV